VSKAFFCAEVAHPGVGTTSSIHGWRPSKSSSSATGAQSGIWTNLQVEWCADQLFTYRLCMFWSTCVKILEHNCQLQVRII